MEEPIQICVIGPDRAGTTHFCSLFDDLPNVVTSKDYTLYEVLKFKGKKPFAEKLEQLQSFLSGAADSGKRFAVYKVMYHQMKPWELALWFRPDDRMIKIVVTRNVLDMYISHRKAKKIRKWRDADTSQVKIWFDYKVKFSKWALIRINYLRALKAVMDDCGYRPLVFDYDTLHKLENDQQKTEYVVERIQQECGFDLGPVGQVASTVTKQDEGASYRDKVYNYNGMMRKVRGRDLELKKIFDGGEFNF